MNEPSLIHTIEDSSPRQLDKNINDMLDRGVNVHLLNESVIVNYEPTSGKNNALMLSAKYTKYIKPATYLRLIEATANKNQEINIKNTRGETALNLFASTDDMEDGNENQNDDVAEQVVSMLLANGADPNIGSGNYSKTPLYNALKNGNNAISMALVNAPNLELNNYHEGSTYLVEAVKQNMLEVVQILLDKGADINTTAPTSGESPLIAAVTTPSNIEYYPQEQQEEYIREREAIIQLLLQRNADRSIRVDMRTAHNIALSYQRLNQEIIAQLIPPAPPVAENNNNNGNINLADAETIGNSNSRSIRNYNKNNRNNNNNNNNNRNNNLQGGKRGKRTIRKTKKTKKTKTKYRKKTRRSSK